MTPKAFYEWMVKQRPIRQQVEMAPGPFAIHMGPADVRAAALLLWLGETLPADTTASELHDILDAAKWWSTFWDSQVKEA